MRPISVNLFLSAFFILHVLSKFYDVDVAQWTRVPVFQTEDAGSIPAIHLNNLRIWNLG